MLGLLIPLFFLADFASLYFGWSYLRPEYGGWLAAGLVALYVFVASVIGGWVIRAGGFLAGVGALKAVQRGESPSKEIVNGLLAFVAGLLVISPGLLSDALALLLVFPPTRALFRWLILRKAEQRAKAREAEGPLEVDYRIE